MNNNPENINTQRVSAIDSSLNMLKQLQAKLKYGQDYYSPINPQPTQPSTHPRLRTQPYSFTQRNTEGAQMAGQSISPKESHPFNVQIGNTYSHSQPTMVQCNQNSYATVKDVMKENRKLKKYVNCLLQMNDYLKNQLVKKDTMGHNKMGHSFQLELVRMEVQYLKELNRDKELQLRKYQHFGSGDIIAQKSKSKKKPANERTPSFHYKPHRNSHYRSSSVYDVLQQTRNPHMHSLQEDYIITSDDLSSHRMKSMQMQHRKNTTKAITSKKNYTKHSYAESKMKVHAKDTIQSGPNKKKGGKETTAARKCRLCYF